MISEFIQTFHSDAAATRAELSAGLLAKHAGITPKYFYDTLGSRLFEAICELPEYYPTRTEAAIFDTHLSAMVNTMTGVQTLIDLGAGNCAEAARLLPLLRPRDYVAVDISVEFLRSALTGLSQRFAQIGMTGVGLDFSQGLQLPAHIGLAQRLFFYPGSSIGNFTTEQALAFLHGVRGACEHDGIVDGALLIGVDLVKNQDRLVAAYDDALGLTAAFNLNVLRHVNKLLNTDFKVQDWRHHAFFNTEHSRIEMHLVARRAVSVSWEGNVRRFSAGESIHTENSYKYTQADFLGLLERTGFAQATVWTDPEQQFMVCHARAV